MAAALTALPPLDPGAMAAVTAALADGRITPDEALACAQMLDGFPRIFSAVLAATIAKTGNGWLKRYASAIWAALTSYFWPSFSARWRRASFNSSWTHANRKIFDGWRRRG